MTRQPLERTLTCVAGNYYFIRAIWRGRQVTIPVRCVHAYGKGGELVDLKNETLGFTRSGNTHNFDVFLTDEYGRTPLDPA